MFLHHALMYETWILFEKFHWQVLLKYKNDTEAICEWRLNCGKYVMNSTDLTLVCIFTFCNQYIAFMYYPYKHFVSFSVLYILHKYLIAFASFSVRHIIKM